MKLAYEVIKNMAPFERAHAAILTGYQSIDRWKDFLYTGKLSLLVGRPAMGKTRFALNLASRVASQGMEVCYISLAESAACIAER